MDAINAMLAAAAFNFKRAMRLLLCLIRTMINGVFEEWILTLMNKGVIQYHLLVVSWVLEGRLVKQQACFRVVNEGVSKHPI